MKELITTLITIFTAEIADKTQFAIISFTAKGFKPINVWLGATLAFCITNFLGVVLGCGLTKVFPHEVLKYLSGLIFIIVGVVTLVTK
ncbi:MAG: TMEM165/GDT1 family protein [Endomicrobia bacterium]|nr:TMEM165/GDT1 family protein [Endomicrobiia bacterium]MCX7940318.1 TMEM165/GDT1 family protein [Endomicrobiia bacterium]MDW8056473.1 TMEM165/GDT1 family protein [Elusimicrobiota bacterium]